MGIRKPRPDYNPHVVERAVCPGCAARLGGVITPACPVCAGRGTITLGRRALYYDTPEAVALAVTIALNAAVDAVQNATLFADLHKEAIPRTLTKLRTLGILDPDDSEAP